MKKILMFALAGMLLLTSCGNSGTIEVKDARARAAMQGGNSAIYFVIQNQTAGKDELIGAASDVANAIEIHESKMEGDMMMMSPVESVLLESSAKVEFKPGGLHIMLIGLKQDLKAGDEIEVILQFKNNPSITVKAMVKEADSMK